MQHRLMYLFLLGGGIATVSLFLVLPRTQRPEHAVVRLGEQMDLHDSTPVNAPLAAPQPPEGERLGPSARVPSLQPSPQDRSHSRAAQARSRADMAAAKAEAIFAKLARYGTALHYSLPALRAEAVYPPGYQPGSDVQVEEARAVRVEARAAELEAVLQRQMQQ